VYFTAGANRTRSAAVRVRHTGGEAEILVNQESDGVTWRYIGTYNWMRGTAQSVVISNRAAPGGDQQYCAGPQPAAPPQTRRPPVTGPSPASCLRIKAVGPEGAGPLDAPARGRMEPRPTRPSS
jgi:hypothetical protein